MIINLTTTEGTQTIIAPDAPPLQVPISTRYAETFTRPVKDVVSDDDAEIGDQFKLITLDASVDPVTYTIDPALFTGLILFIRSKDDTQGTNVAADSGVIELMNGDDVTSLQILVRQMIKLYSDGTNLIEVA